MANKKKFIKKTHSTKQEQLNIYFKKEKVSKIKKFLENEGYKIDINYKKSVYLYTILSMIDFYNSNYGSLVSIRNKDSLISVLNKIKVLIISHPQFQLPNLQEEAIPIEEEFTKYQIMKFKTYIEKYDIIRLSQEAKKIRNF